MPFKKIKNILEYVTNPIVWFKKYLTMTDVEKALDLVDLKPTLYGLFADEKYITLPDDFDADDDSYVETLSKEERLEFGKWLLRMEISAGDEYSPSWVLMDYSEIIKNQWLVHLTGEPHNIVKEGFMYGLEDYSRLALTKHTGTEKVEDKDYAYIFAYTVDDFKKYGRRTRSSSYKYGQQAVVFRSSGIRVWHNGDEEYQTIFMASTAKDFVPIKQTGNSDKPYYVSISEKYKDTDNIYFNTIEEGVDWITKNYDQYRKRVVKRRLG